MSSLARALIRAPILAVEHGTGELQRMRCCCSKPRLGLAHFCSRSSCEIVELQLQGHNVRLGILEHRPLQVREPIRAVAELLAQAFGDGDLGPGDPRHQLGAPTQDLDGLLALEPCGRDEAIDPDVPVRVVPVVSTARTPAPLCAAKVRSAAMGLSNRLRFSVWGPATASAPGVAREACRLRPSGRLLIAHDASPCLSHSAEAWPRLRSFRRGAGATWHASEKVPGRGPPTDMHEERSAATPATVPVLCT